MQISICIQAEVDEHATSFYNAPIEDVTDGRVWLLVNYWRLYVGLRACR